MNIIVCIKQVLASSEFKINPETGTIMRDGNDQMINPPDLHAIEEGIRLKERYGGKVYVVSMGIFSVENLLREAISYGIDEGYLLSDKAFSGADTLATSYTLSCGIKKICHPDIIILGKQTIDSDTGQVGPELAEHLNIPHVTEVRKIETIDNQGFVCMERQLENGCLSMKAKKPLLITVLKEINEPRTPTLRGRIVARKKIITKWGLKDLNVDSQKVGLKGSPTQVVRLLSPKVTRDGNIFPGNVKNSVDSLFSVCPFLRNKKEQKQ